MACFTEHNNFKCVFTDLDKTLLASGSILTDFTRQTIETLISRGIDFIPSSGRAFNSLPKDLLSIKGLKYCVTSNGVCINDANTGMPLSVSYILPEILDELHAFIAGMDVAIEYFTDGQGYGNRDYYEHPEKYRGYIPERMPYYLATRKPLDDVEKFAAENRSKIEAFDILADPELIGTLMPRLKERFPELYMTNSENYLIEVSDKDSGKNKGMERCCRILGVSPGQCIAFGDAANDIEMLKSAGLGIAVANASDECRKAADYVSEFTHDEDAVARELQRIFNFSLIMN
ncbi:MAG: HAD family hydrolase [Treponema sp.]|nr:HAD family hydrolase [Treponema sp.]